MPTLFVTVWISFLGATLWQSQHNPKRGTMDEKSNDPILDETNSADHASEHTCNSDGESSSGNFDDYPAFSPEGMIKWMFERCYRRYEEAMMVGDRDRAESYNSEEPCLWTSCNTSVVQVRIKGSQRKRH